MFRKLILNLLTLGLLLTACAPTAPVPVIALTGIHLTDGLGREVNLPGPAQRVISLAPSNTEILFAIGAGPQVVGRDHLSDYPEAAKTVTDIGSTYEALNTEQIVALKPDLILAAEVNTPEQVKSLESLGLTVYYLKNPATLEEMYGNLEIAAQLTGHANEAAALIDALKARVAAVDARIVPISSRPSVFYEMDATDPAKPYTAGKDTFITLLIERAGGHNIAADLDGYPQLSLEQIVASNPDFIILGDAAYGTSPASVAARPGWADLSAVKNNHVVAFDDNLVSRPGPRLVDALETLAKILHPGLFQ